MRRRIGAPSIFGEEGGTTLLLAFCDGSVEIYCTLWSFIIRGTVFHTVVLASTLYKDFIQCGTGFHSVEIFAYLDWF